MVLFIKASVASTGLRVLCVLCGLHDDVVCGRLRGKDFDYVKHQPQLRKVRASTGRRHLLCQYRRDLILISNTWTHVADLDWPRERMVRNVRRTTRTTRMHAPWHGPCFITSSRRPTAPQEGW
jgi:hypothetical protein